MNTFKRTITAVTLIAILVSGTDAQAAGEAFPTDTITAAKKITELFSKLLKPFEAIGETAERQYLIDALVDLNRALFELEQEKRYVIIALKRRPLVQNELQRASLSIRGKIRSLQESLAKVGPKLRVAYRADADEAISLLTTALFGHSAVAFTEGGFSESNAASDIESSKAAAKALSDAQIKLADVIVALQKQ